MMRHSARQSARDGFTVLEVVVVMIVLTLVWSSYRLVFAPRTHAIAGLKQMIWAQDLAEKAFLNAQSSGIQNSVLMQATQQDKDLPTHYLLSSTLHGASITFRSEYLSSVLMPGLETISLDEEVDYNVRVSTRAYPPTRALVDKRLLYQARDE